MGCSPLLGLTHLPQQELLNGLQVRDLIHSAPSCAAAGQPAAPWSWCEKHTVANNIGTGEDLSEVIILFAIAMAGVSQAREHVFWLHVTVYILYPSTTGTLPSFPINWVVQVHNLSHAS